MLSGRLGCHCSGEQMACCEVLVMVEVEEEVRDADA